MSSSERHRGRRSRRRWPVVVAALLGAAPAGAGARLDAQGGVSGRVVIVERVGVDPGDLRGAVVYLEGAPGGAAAGGTAPRSAEIEMSDREFVPHVRAVQVGGTVSFPNRDPFSHNVFSNAQGGPFDLGLYRRGASRAALFPRPGVYPIFCNIHSRMAAYVVAVPEPYVALARADGTFALGGVPAGRYLLRAWHERAGSVVTLPIDVPPSGVAELRVVLDARTYIPSPHLNKFGLPYAATRPDRY